MLTLFAVTGPLCCTTSVMMSVSSTLSSRQFLQVPFLLLLIGIVASRLSSIVDLLTSFISVLAITIYILLIDNYNQLLIVFSCN